MPRCLEPEWLDELPAHDGRSIRSRQDLRRINRLLGHVGILARVWRQQGKEQPIHRVVDLGAGDGTFLLRLIRRAMKILQAPREVVLVDRQPTVDGETIEQFSRLGCKVEVAVQDAFDWLSEDGSPAGTAIVANLFLHHFGDDQLRRLLEASSQRCHRFAACEPRRSAVALAASRSLGLIGCNSVTRHDAVVSVKAGFKGRELSALWPSGPGWLVEEREAGLFSHCFLAYQESGKQGAG